MSHTSLADPDEELPSDQRFLLRVGEVLHSLGTPSHRLEALMVRLAESLGITAQFLSTPTSLIASLGRGRMEQTRLLRAAPGEVNLGKLVELDELLEDVEDGKVQIEEALERLEALVAAKSRFGPWLSGLAFGVSAGGAAVFLGGELYESLTAFVLGLLIFAFGFVWGRSPDRIFLNDGIMSFAAALGAVLVDRFVVPIDYGKVTLATLIILLPGLSFTVAMLELATRHLSSGVARLAGAATTLLIIVLGVALAWRLGGAGEAHTGAMEIPTVARWVIMAVVPIGFGVLFQVRIREWWVVYLAGGLGYAGALLGREWLGPELAPFLGALLVGLVGNLYARVFDRPSSVAHMPGILLLVPGTVGYQALTLFLAKESDQGALLAFQTTLVGAALVGGLLSASALLPPKRAL